MARRVRKSRADIQRWNQMISSLRLMNLAFTNVRLYPATHPEVKNAVTQLHQIINPIVEEQEDVGYGFMDSMIYLEGAMSLEETANNQMLVDRFSKCRVKYLTFMKGISMEDLVTFFQVLNAEATKPSDETPGEILYKKGVTTVHIVEAELEDEASKGKMVRKKTLLDWYEKAVNTLLAAEDQLRKGGSGDLKSLFRVIDDMTATVRNKGHEPFLLLPLLGKGMDAHACHSVNVGIFCCALGEIYGLNSGQISSLCAYAFLHDIGRLTIPSDWTRGKQVQTAEERELISQHTTWGCLWLLFREDLPPQLGLLAAQHHLKSSGNGAEENYLPDVYHKILAIADEYDLCAMSSSYYWKLHPKKRILARIINSRGVRHDTPLVKLLSNCVSLYPVGSLVQLDDGQRGIVVRPGGGECCQAQSLPF